VVNWAGKLRDSLRKSTSAWATERGISYYQSLGQEPTVLFERAPDGSSHGNFHPDSWREIAAQPTWVLRAEKRHSQANRSLPPDKAAGARELDSSNSSDALLMNCFCFPEASGRILDALGVPGSMERPEFGFKARLPLVDGSTDATEIDMKIGTTLFEAKLTEADFTRRSKAHVQRYRDLDTYFDVGALPMRGEEVMGYQLVRNVLAAAHYGARLVILLDQRRPDLVEEWSRVRTAIQNDDLRTRCQSLTWQQVAASCPAPLADFLSSKYGV